jgi:Putative transposase
VYKKHWIVDCAKPSTNHKHNVTYLGGYVKRPPIAESKLRHYDGHEVTFNYLDHTSKTRKTMTLTSEEFIGRFVNHIPDKNFRMIRYYGFLANRMRGTLLPLVHQLLGQNIESTLPSPTYSQLIQKAFGFNPLTCILCGSNLVLSMVLFGRSSVHQLLPYHSELALLKKIPA